MSWIALHAMPAIVAVSAVGAAIVCALVVAYGFTPPSEEDPDRALRRMLVLRLGHAVAVVCFGAAAILAVIARSTVSSTVPQPSLAPTAANELSQRTEQVETRGGEETRELEQRLASVESTIREMTGRLDRASGEIAAPPAQAEQPELPPRARTVPPVSPSRPPRGRHRPVTPPPASEWASAAESQSSVSALPLAATGHVTTTVEGVRVNVSREATDRDTSYTVHLSDVTGHPLAGARVMVEGRSTDGRKVQAALDPTATPGLYAARIASRRDGPRQLALHVVHGERDFTVPFGD